ncbi:MAG TPA: 5-deoxy-glucuronate isomerase [Candidatus Krumholzibacteria bacterium]|nr:5-deoxy-glucuronate isomerase [Candidatus Krumholzibacteria bacterium]
MRAKAADWEWGRDLPKSRADLITRGSDAFPPGFTGITAEEDPVLGQGVDFGIHVLGRDDQLELTDAKESAWVLMQGSARVVLDGREVSVERRSLFDDAPTVLHLGPQTRLAIQAQSERVEWAVARVTNPSAFAARVFWPHEIVPEYRGLGLAQGTCLRNVRLVFDRKVRPESRLVLGEVVNYPGRWSSYPPHHHAQPEIYHYRFSAPHGYGHGEAGNRVYKVRHNDTLRIAAQQDHAQVAAPGYAMYYLWIVRHLEDSPYAGFEYAAEHTWILDPAAPIWEPATVPLGPPVANPRPPKKRAASGTKRRRRVEPPGARPRQVNPPGAPSRAVEATGAHAFAVEPPRVQSSGVEPGEAQSSVVEPGEAQSSGVEPGEAQSSGVEPDEAHEAGNDPND